MLINSQLHFDCKNTLGESCFLDPRDGCLWWTDIQGKCAWKMDAKDKTARFPLPDRAGFILPRKTEGFVIGFPNALVLANQDLTEFNELHKVEAEISSTRINDAAVDPFGGIVFGTFDETPDAEERKPIGGVYRLGADGSLKKLFGQVVVANGLAFSPTGDVMYFADTFDGRIRRFKLADGFSKFEETEPLAEHDAAPGMPDGGKVDAKGNYWSARVWGGCVVRFDPSGNVTAEVKVPVKGPTCLAFNGESLRTMYITTLRTRHSEEELSVTPDAGGIFTAEVDIGGTRQLLCSL